MRESYSKLPERGCRKSRTRNDLASLPLFLTAISSLVPGRGARRAWANLLTVVRGIIFA